jgi:hypothetical protein
MFETENFKTQLTDAITREVGASGLAEYDARIIEYLQRQAAGNEKVLMEQEIRKVAGERRGVANALISARKLIKEASKYAAADRRTLLRMSDFQTSYAALFCQVWPFCK